MIIIYNTVNNISAERSSPVTDDETKEIPVKQRRNRTTFSSVQVR